jgi:4-hydroxy-tetrahydrodipicolinate synthase
MANFKRKPLEGIFALMPLCTKENQEQDIDYEAIESNIDALEKIGMHGFIQFGCMGQMNAPSEEEFNKVCDVCVESSRNKNIACIVSSTATSTKEAIRRAKYAEDAGADGTMIALPYAFPVVKDWAIEFYQMVDDALHGDIAVMLYNYPPLTGFNVTPSMWRDDLLQIDSIKAIKEANMAIPHHDESLLTVAEQINFFSGSEPFFWHDSMLGGKGVIGILTWVAPKVLLKFYDECRKGNQMDEWVLQVYKILVKAFGKMMSAGVPMDSYEHDFLNALAEMGGFKAGNPRKPYNRLPEKVRKDLEEALNPLIEMEKTM